MVETVTEIDTLHRTNEQLAQENARLAAENARTKELERQNELLTALLEVKGSLGFDTVTGSVVGRESAQFRRVITVDVGADHGVKEGDVVVGAGGALVGRVTGVTGNSATILLINDTSSTVIGQLGANQATGSIIGQLGGVLIMENIDSAERLQIGDTVTTAGIDLGGGVRSPFPKGLLDRQRRRRPARRERGDPDGVHPAGGRPRPSSSTCWSSPTTRAVCHRSTSSRSHARPAGRCPRASSPASPSRRSRDRDADPVRAATLPPDEGHRPGRWDRDPALSADDRHQQAPPADLRPADDLLPDRDAGRDGDPRGDGHRRRQERRRRRRAARRRLALRARPDLPLPARRAGDRPRHRAGPRLRRRRGRSAASSATTSCAARRWSRSLASSTAGPWGAGTLLYRVPDPERFGVAELDAAGSVVGFEEKPERPEERPHPDRRLLPAPRRLRR